MRGEGGWGVGIVQPPQLRPPLLRLRHQDRETEACYIKHTHTHTETHTQTNRHTHTQTDTIKAS